MKNSGVRHISNMFVLGIILLLNNGCASDYNLSDQINTIESKDVTLQPRSLHSNNLPDLPYDEIVSNLGQLPYYDISNDTHFNNFINYLHLINKEVADNASLAYGLNFSQKQELTRYINDNIYSEGVNYFKILKEKLYQIENLPGGSISGKYPTYTSARQFSNVLATYTCNFIQLALTFAIKRTSVSVGSVTLKGVCEHVATESILPISEELKNRSLLVDHLNSSVVFTEHIRQMIMELATVEDNISAIETNQRTRNFLFFKSSAELEMEIKARVKAGFDLKNHFKVNIVENENVVNVYLPKAKILSIDIVPIVKNINDGWFVGVDEQHINDTNEILRQRVTDRAINSGLLFEAERNAETILKGILKPLFSTPIGDFGVNVQFVDDIIYHRVTEF